MKSIFKSKVFWVAVAQAVVGLIGVFYNAYPTVGWLLMAKSSMDIVLRFLTTQPVQA